MENNQLIITPRTKVLQVIEAYPPLEDVLISYIPAFKKLKNPILRKTVARITTLQQAAAIGNVTVEELINRLRKEVGQDLFEENMTTTYQTTKPEWFDPQLIAHELDAKNMLAAGEHPVNQVMAELQNMENGKIYKLVAPFLPAPLIDKALSLGVEHWVEKVSDTDFRIYFFKK